MMTSPSQPQTPDHFPGKHKSLANMLSVNAYLRAIVDALLSLAFKQCGGGFRPTWTTSGARYQYIPKQVPSGTDIIELFETLLDFQSEVVHEMNQLYLSGFKHCEGYNAKLWHIKAPSSNMNCLALDGQLHSYIAQCFRLLDRLVGPRAIAREFLLRAHQMFLSGFRYLRSFIARFADLDHSGSPDMLATVEELNSHDEEINGSLTTSGVEVGASGILGGEISDARSETSMGSVQSLQSRADQVVCESTTDRQNEHGVTGGHQRNVADEIGGSRDHH